MSIVYQHDNKGRYLGQCDDYNGPLPHNCVTAGPPVLPWDHVWPRWNGQAWELIEDHRARRVAEGFAPELAQEPTDYWLPSQGDGWRSPAREMKRVGPLPEGAVRERPKKPLPTTEELFTALRAERDQRIAAMDYLVLPDYPQTEEARARIGVYRQALRDLPGLDGAPWDGGGPETPWPPAPVPAS